MNAIASDAPMLIGNIVKPTGPNQWIDEMLQTILTWGVPIAGIATVLFGCIFICFRLFGGPGPPVGCEPNMMNVMTDTEGRELVDVWDDAAVAVTRHDAVQARWARWHTDLDLLIEYPAIHDVAHEKFALRILDTAEAAKTALEIWEVQPQSMRHLQGYVAAVDAFDKALLDGEHQARLLGRGPSLDPVLKRVMDDAAHLVEVLRRPDTTDDERDRTMRALFKALKPVIGEQVVKIPEIEPFVMKQLTTTKTK